MPARADTELGRPSIMFSSSSLQRPHSSDHTPEHPVATINTDTDTNTSPTHLAVVDWQSTPPKPIRSTEYTVQVTPPGDARPPTPTVEGQGEARVAPAEPDLDLTEAGVARRTSRQRRGSHTLAPRSDPESGTIWEDDGSPTLLTGQHPVDPAAGGGEKDMGQRRCSRGVAPRGSFSQGTLWPDFTASVASSSRARRKSEIISALLTAKASSRASPRARHKSSTRSRQATPAPRHAIPAPQHEAATPAAPSRLMSAAFPSHPGVARGRTGTRAGAQAEVGVVAGTSTDLCRGMGVGERVDGAVKAGERRTSTSV